MIQYSGVIYTKDDAIASIKAYADSFSTGIIQRSVSGPYDSNARPNPILPYPAGVSQIDFPSGYLETYSFVRENLGSPVNGIDYSIFVYDPEYHTEESPRAMMQPFEDFAARVCVSLSGYTDQVNYLVASRLWKMGDDEGVIAAPRTYRIESSQPWIAINHGLGYVPQVVMLSDEVENFGGVVARKYVTGFDVYVPEDDPKNVIILNGLVQVSNSTDFGTTTYELPFGTIYLL
jgi:hypothetical protein